METLSTKQNHFLEVALKRYNQLHETSVNVDDREFIQYTFALLLHSVSDEYLDSWISYFQLKTWDLENK